jgi:hypothetical protein
MKNIQIGNDRLYKGANIIFKGGNKVTFRIPAAGGEIKIPELISTKKVF